MPEDESGYNAEFETALVHKPDLSRPVRLDTQDLAFEAGNFDDFMGAIEV